MVNVEVALKELFKDVGKNLYEMAKVCVDCHDDYEYIVSRVLHNRIPLDAIMDLRYKKLRERSYTFAQFEQDCQDNTAYGLRKLFLHPIDSVHLHYFHANVPKRMSLRELYDLHSANMGKSLILILKGRDWLTPEA